MPTRFDTRVPKNFWASESWRKDHPREIQALEAHRNVPAMHADLVPTLLGAADIRYAEPRKDVVDLTRAAPGARTRWVEPRLGVAVDGDRLQ
jgi:arylsulfatase A-like enzyme